MDSAMVSAANVEEVPVAPPTGSSVSSTITSSEPAAENTAPSPDMAMPFEKTEPVYEVTFRVTGGFGVLRELNNYLKMNNISYEIISQKKK